MAKANTSAVIVATIAKVAVARPTPTNAHKYGAAHKATGGTSVAYTLTKGGQLYTNGLGSGGKPTVMAMVCATVARLAAVNTPATPQAIVLAMRTHGATLTALRAMPKAAKYMQGGMPCHAWLAGYVRGAASAKHGLLA
jgi:hypothetical protein